MSDLNNFSNVRQELGDLQKNTKKVDDAIDFHLKQLKDSKIDLSGFHSDCRQILEGIGKISASNVKIKISLTQLEEEVAVKIERSFDEWATQLQKKLVINSEGWSSEYCPRKNRKKFVEDYFGQLNKSMADLLNQWTSKDLEELIMSYANNVYNSICVEFNKIGILKILSFDEVVYVDGNCQEKAKYLYRGFKQKQTYDNLSYDGDDNTKRVGFVEGSKLVALDVAATSLGAGVGTTVGFSAAVGGVMLGIGAGLVLPVIPISLITGTILGAKAMTKNHSHDLEKEIRLKIIEVGCNEIKTRLSKVKLNIMSWIKREVFPGIINCIDNSFACAISQYENKLELLNSNIEMNTAANIEIELKLAALKDIADKLKKLQHKYDSCPV